MSVDQLQRMDYSCPSFDPHRVMFYPVYRYAPLLPFACREGMELSRMLICDQLQRMDYSCFCIGPPAASRVGRSSSSGLFFQRFPPHQRTVYRVPSAQFACAHAGAQH